MGFKFLVFVRTSLHWEDGWLLRRKCINARRLAADIFMIRTEGTAGEKFPKEPGLKICRMTGNARYAVPAKKCLNHLADEA